MFFHVDEVFSPNVSEVGILNAHIRVSVLDAELDAELGQGSKKQKR